MRQVRPEYVGRILQKLWVATKHGWEWTEDDYFFTEHPSGVLYDGVAQFTLSSLYFTAAGTEDGSIAVLCGMFDRYARNARALAIGRHTQPCR